MVMSYVIASDSVPAPNMLSSNVTITINILDVNDLPPMFQHDGYATDLFEDEPIGTIVSDDIIAIDDDTDKGEKSCTPY